MGTTIPLTAYFVYATRKAAYAKWLKRIPEALRATLRRIKPYEHIIIDKARKYNIDPDLIRAVITQESTGRHWVERVEIWKGNVIGKSVGLMQILFPDTARFLDYTGTQEGLKDPAINIELGAKYLAYQTKRYKGFMEEIIAAYNAGSAIYEFGKLINQGYVNSVLRYYRSLKEKP